MLNHVNLFQFVPRYTIFTLNFIEFVFNKRLMRKIEKQIALKWKYDCTEIRDAMSQVCAQSRGQASTFARYRGISYE